MKFVAKLHRNFNKLGTERVLLTGVHNETTNELFRDHCWINISNNIKKLIPTTNKESIVISFHAEIEDYPYPTKNQDKKRLVKVRKVTIGG